MTSTHLPRWFRLNNNNKPTTKSFSPRLTPQCLTFVIFNPSKWKQKTQHTTQHWVQTKQRNTE